MNTVKEIESAIERLPSDQFFEIQHWVDRKAQQHLERKLGPQHPPEGYFADAYETMAQDEERMKLEAASLKVPQSAER